MDADKSLELHRGRAGPCLLLRPWHSSEQKTHPSSEKVLSVAASGRSLRQGPEQPASSGVSLSSNLQVQAWEVTGKLHAVPQGWAWLAKGEAGLTAYTFKIHTVTVPVLEVRGVPGEVFTFPPQIIR